MASLLRPRVPRAFGAPKEPEEVTNLRNKLLVEALTKTCVVFVLFVDFFLWNGGGASLHGETHTIVWYITLRLCRVRRRNDRDLVLILHYLLSLEALAAVPYPVLHCE